MHVLHVCSTLEYLKYVRIKIVWVIWVLLQVLVAPAPPRVGPPGGSILAALVLVPDLGSDRLGRMLNTVSASAVGAEGLSRVCECRFPHGQRLGAVLVWSPVVTPSIIGAATPLLPSCGVSRVSRIFAIMATSIDHFLNADRFSVVPLGAKKGGQLIISCRPRLSPVWH
jgi:hypothetical protein